VIVDKWHGALSPLHCSFLDGSHTEYLGTDDMTAQRAQLYKQAALQLQEQCTVVCARHATKFGSPIEELLCEAIVAWAWVNGDLLAIDNEQAAARYRLSLQHKISSYRADFFLRDILRNAAVVIEADGHNFHDRTTEQAAYDRARDREMQTLGYVVLRFTGSEIHHDPWACANSIFKGLARAADVRDGVAVKQEPLAPKPSRHVSPQLRALAEKLAGEHP
jgi:very-short-patch-repair endonuclease